MDSLYGKPEEPADRCHHPDLGLTPVLLGHQEDVEVGAQGAANVRKQEVQRVERERS